jgi:predicted RNA-binding protein with PIN domain
MATVLIDAENVRRSCWPNAGRERLFELAEEWAARTGHDVVVVFDGGAPEGAVGSGRESADEWIERRAAELAERGEPYWLVTSDRALRAAAGARAERTIGGGAFAGELGLS